jgi:hypothetical protein
VELVNAGKGAALLIELAELVPRGFEVIEKPAAHAIEGGSLKVKGARLEPLKSEKYSLVLRAGVQGLFPFKPRVLFLDEGGSYQRYAMEAVNVNVIKQIGIKDWFSGRV